MDVTRGKMAINTQFYSASYQLQSCPRTKSVLFLSSHTINVEQPESLKIDFQNATNFLTFLKGLEPIRDKF